MPPPPPLFPICVTPHAKESFPVVQTAHLHLRHASDTIHQHRNSLASQLRSFDSRWAHLFSVAPVLNKLTKGRQRPEEFQKNAENLDEDVQAALAEAQKRKQSEAQARVPDEQDTNSLIPGPLPAPSAPASDTMFSRVSRKVKALSSIVERVERGDQIHPSTSKSSKSPYGSKSSRQSKDRTTDPTKNTTNTKNTNLIMITPENPTNAKAKTPSKLKVSESSTRRPVRVRVRKKDSRQSMGSVRSGRSVRSFTSVRSTSSFHHPIPTRPPSRDSRDRQKNIVGRDRDRDREKGLPRYEYRERERERERDLERGYRDREDRDRDSRDRDKHRHRERDRNRDRERNRDRSSRERARDRDRDRDRDYDRHRRDHRDYRDGERTRHARYSPSRTHRRERYERAHQEHQESTSPVPGYSTYNSKPPEHSHSGQRQPTKIPTSSSDLPPIYAQFATVHDYDYDNDEELRPPVLPFVTEGMERRRREKDEKKERQNQYRYDTREHNPRGPPPSSHPSYPLPSSSPYHPHPQNPQNPPNVSSPDASRGRGRERQRERERTVHPSSGSTRPRAGYNGYNGYDGYTYSSTSTPIVTTLSHLPDPSAPINATIDIPAPSSHRHLSRSRYPPSKSTSRSPYLRAREDLRGYHGDHHQIHGKDVRNGGYNRYNGYESQAQVPQASHGQAPQAPQVSHPLQTSHPPPPHSTRSPRSPRSPRSHRSPLIMRSRFKENFSVLQSESGR